MAPARSDIIATVPAAIPKSAQRVKKRQYKKVRYFKNGLLDVERKTGKYLKIARQNQRESPLLKLPAEIRNVIFQYALGGVEYDIEEDKDIPPRNIVKAKYALALLGVCRQIYGETALLPFSLNTFSTCLFPMDLKIWMAQRHPAQMSVVTSIHIKVRVVIWKMVNGGLGLIAILNEAERDFSGLPALKHIHVTLLRFFKATRIRAHFKGARDRLLATVKKQIETKNPGKHITIEGP